MQISHARSGAGILGLALATLAALAIAVPAAQAAKPSKPSKDVSVQLLGINDFHGNLEPPTGSGGVITDGRRPVTAVPAGGAVYLANQLRTLRQQNPNSLTVAAGDLIGASPLLSALFHDEPTIEAMNQMGLDLTSVGNHEFDEGVTELLRMQNGGCRPDNGCHGRDAFGGADFGYLAANVVYKDTGKPIFPPYAIRKFGGIKVGFIGMTLEGTPEHRLRRPGSRTWTSSTRRRPSTRSSRELRKSTACARSSCCCTRAAHRPRLRDRLLQRVRCDHGHRRPHDRRRRPLRDGSHPPAVRLHRGQRQPIDGRPVTSASSFGRLVTNIGFKLDHKTKDIKDVTADNTVVTRTQTPAADIQQLIDSYNVLAAPIANQLVGPISATINRTNAPVG